MNKRIIIGMTTLALLSTAALVCNAQEKAKRNDGDTPLHRAGNLEVVKLLVAQGADVNAKNKDERTPLHEMLWRERGNASNTLEIVKFLVSNGADVNAQERYGYTPLHLAKDIEVVKYVMAL